MYWLRRFTFLLAFLLSLCLIAWAVPRYLDPTAPNPHRRDRDRRWVNTSPYFLDRQVCRWLGLCGLHHLRKDPASRGQDEWGDDDDDGEELDELKLKARTRALSWEDIAAPQPEDKKRNHDQRRRILKDVPNYVLKHAPLIHLYSGEDFWPSDIRDHVEHMTVIADGKPLNLTDHDLNLNNLQELNSHEGNIVLRSNDDVESRPHWLHSHDNIPTPFDDEMGDGEPSPPPPPPSDPGHSPFRQREPTTWFDVDKQHPLHRIAYPRMRKGDWKKKTGPQPLVARGHKPDSDGRSQAPAVLVVVDKGSGIVDAFWFFFYSYNLGQTVLGIRFGNHVGDWEHCMMRFENGQPRGVFLSEHEGGQGYAWDAVEKSSSGGRPVIYSAVGSHAMYALPGTHPYVLPFQMLKDVTDKGPLWDPALNKYAYHYDYTLETEDDRKIVTDPGSLVPAASNPQAPTSWFHFGGNWGDEVYPLADPRQWRFFGQYHYVRGPIGPKFKALGRSKVCQVEPCRILYKLDPKATWY